MGSGPHRRRPGHAHSGEMVRQAVIAGLLPPATASSMWACARHRPCSLGCGSSARRAESRLPPATIQPEWNALKFIGPDALFLRGARGRELLDIYHQGEYRRVRGAEMRGIESRPTCSTSYAGRSWTPLACCPRRRRRLRVALDSCNGAGSLVTPKLIEALGAEVVTIYTTPDGSFQVAPSHAREPVGALRPGEIERRGYRLRRRTWTPTGWRRLRPGRAHQEELTLVPRAAGPRAHARNGGDEPVDHASARRPWRGGVGCRVVRRPSARRTSRKACSVRRGHRR